MSRMTQAQMIQAENEAYALLFFKRMLSSLPDPRRKQGIRYPLETVIVIALMACICGIDDAEGMEAWGDFNETWLSTFLAMPHGIPTQDVFLSVLGALSPEPFEQLLISWASLLSLRLKGQQIAIDGKSSRGSADRCNGKSAIHLLNAYSVEAGMVIGQLAVDGKTNEITAIPELIHLLDICGATITVDAIGCQNSIASCIVENGGNYLLAVKENQRLLHHDIETAFSFVDDKAKQVAIDLLPCAVEKFTQTEKGHGRLEERTIEIARDLSWLSEPAKWRGIDFFVRVTRTRTILATDKTSKEVAYYIGSDESANAQKNAELIRNHWSIENKVHWILDTGFNEDDARHRAGNAAQNIATIRKFALNIIKNDKTRKLGVANTRKIAGYNRNMMIDLLTKSTP